MNIHTATHYGMCFGVREALRRAHDAAASGPVTILGALVHNPVVQEHLTTLGVREGRLEEVGGAATATVMITAHGAADRDRAAWKGAGYRVTDTTCPLVHKAHTALAQLVAEGCQPVVIGQRGHVEVRGLTGDFPGTVVLESEADFSLLPPAAKYGIVSQTTQPIVRVRQIVAALRVRFPGTEIRFRDTVCQPTKDRQNALDQLCSQCDVVVVIGGRHSNNTRQLTESARARGVTVHQIETPADLQPAWFRGCRNAGVTAGTSTLDETVRDVIQRMREICPN
ncbi:MAG TPA: 4-hydroxy-3-methylbut-2-enyl diphosphate reductase [Verrucomicrobiales bacterium]|jgi:4-hydroxy-3-methylbut-2-enyl diphosphate reductase|nr:4-hydroxy-3-methylbut-2-enyl diphosphate reductase [Verrucomicrobiales bacterium]